jgi:hypothetical protein
MEFIFYSRGESRFDNTPEQRKADSFGDFVDAILADVSSQKGLAYICAPFTAGQHSKPQQHPGIKAWRQKHLALPCRFLALDIDSFDSPQAFDDLKDFLQRFSCLIYTTASSRPEVPRARVLLELDRDVTADELSRIAVGFEGQIQASLGVSAMKFDPSVYTATQPIYTPVVGFDHARCLGQALNVDLLLAEKVNSSRLNNAPSYGQKLLAHLTDSIPWDGELVYEGARNTTMLKIVGGLRRQGLTEDQVTAQARAINASRFIPPLDDVEVAQICSRYAHQGRSLGTAFAGETAGVQSSIGDGCLKLSSVPPAPRAYTLGDEVTRKTLAVIGGQGGVSKTMLAMQLCVCAAIGKPFGDMKIAEGASMLFLGEEDEPERDRRMSAICMHMGADLKTVAQRVRAYAAAGVDLRLTQRVEGNPQPTGVGDLIVAQAMALQKESGKPITFIVVDHARLVIGGDPNDAQDVTQLTRELTRVARDTGAAVLLLAHSPKSVANKKGDEINAFDVAGSGAFVDNARAAYMMWTMRAEDAKDYLVADEERQKYVAFSNVKSNYGPTGRLWWLKRELIEGWDVAVLVPTLLRSARLFQSKGVKNLRMRVLDVIRSHPCTTIRRLRDRAGKTNSLGASESKVRVEVEKMLEEGVILRRRPTAQERREHRLASGVREVLHVAADAVGVPHES